MKIFLLAFTLCLAACASRPDLSDWTPPIQNSHAAFLWKHRGGSLAGEADITNDIRGDMSIRLTKELPKPLLEITSMTDGRFSAEGPLAGGGWSGDASRAPARFSLWTALAAAWRGAYPARDGRQEVHTDSYRAAVWKDAGRIRELSVSSNDNGEVIRLVFR
ncbi:MAG: hypothetical protein WCH98_05985 [Verrucomicrobiota bacterium]